MKVVGQPTGMAYITITPDGENSIVVSPGANRTVIADDVTAALSQASVVVISLEIPIQTVEEVVVRAVSNRVRTVLNLSPVAEISEQALAAVDVLVVNEHEAAWLLGGSEVEASRLRELGPEAVVVTLGARGALVVTPTAADVVPAPPAKAVDTTGAGDAFTGAVAHGLAQGFEVLSAVHLAVHVAAFSVTKMGAQSSYPSARDLSFEL
jgi:ribokinase